ncbi:MAG: HEAT repeat domain-containing protein [Anaerolineaceae bacterium]|nr:HEAT repeat domain-containing protein [Anaerolineaceae bacterium]
MADALGKARAALRDGDAQTRVGGLQLVQSLSLRAALPEVGERLRSDEDVAVRYQAARTLVQFADPASLSSLLQGLRDEDMYVRVQVTSALIHVGAAAVEGLTEALGDGRPAVRRAAAMALGKIGHRDHDALRALVGALKDVDAAQRRFAAQALGRLGATEAVEALGVALRDPDARVRDAAATALLQLGDVALPTLRAALDDPNPETNFAAARALTKGS